MGNIKFMIQANEDQNRDMLPSQDFGYTAIEAVRFSNWWDRTSDIRYSLTPLTRLDKIANFAKLAPQFEEIVPIGSVEYVLQWLQLMGYEKPKPLNIPEELWRYCHRRIAVSDGSDLKGKWMCKDLAEFKSPHNGPVMLSGGPLDKTYFLSAWMDDVVSEWRVFVYKGEVKGLRCYSGDEWVLPNKHFVEQVVRAYQSKKAYTLDVMVRENGLTDIVELHDFFSCGLYGFDDALTLINMWLSAFRALKKSAVQ